MMNFAKNCLNLPKQASLTIKRCCTGMYGKASPKYKSRKQNNSTFFDERTMKNEIKGEIIFGVHPVRLALLAKRRSNHCLYVNENVLNSSKNEVKDILRMAETLSIPLYVQTNFVLSALSGERPHQGFCLDASKLYFKTPDSCQIKEDLVNEKRCVILDGIHDPMNLGSIMRTCYYFGYNKVLICDKNNCKPSAVVSKASSGALEMMDVYAVPDLVEFISVNLLEDWLLIGASTNNSAEKLNLAEANKFLDRKVALVFGNEEIGIGQTLETLMHKHITIPAASYPNLVGCLNVSVAAGILLQAFSCPNTD